MRAIYDDKEPEMIESVVCYIDILGFTKLVEESCHNGKGNDLLKKMNNAINEYFEIIKPIDDSSGRIKVFTDNAVIGRPIFDDGESELGHTFINFSAYQFALALEGFFVRGAITIGDFYINQQIAFGPALLEAYGLESTKTSEPRIILSDSAIDLVKSHLNYYADARSAPQTTSLLKDIDGQWFLNYLNASIVEYNPEYFDMSIDYLKKHKEQVVEKLYTYRNEPRILRKYIWVANYHNYFCKENFNWVDELQIDKELLLLNPKLIIEE